MMHFPFSPALLHTDRKVRNVQEREISMHVSLVLFLPSVSTGVAWASWSLWVFNKLRSLLYIALNSGELTVSGTSSSSEFCHLKNYLCSFWTWLLVASFDALCFMYWYTKPTHFSVSFMMRLSSLILPPGCLRFFPREQSQFTFSINDHTKETFCIYILDIWSSLVVSKLLCPSTCSWGGRDKTHKQYFKYTQTVGSWQSSSFCSLSFPQEFSIFDLPFFDLRRVCILW